MRHVYVYNGHDISEEMLLGIGAGVSFSYWHFKGQPPFMGARGNVGMAGQEGLEKTAGRRTGVVVDKFRTGSTKKAEKTLLDMLAAGRPVMMTLDMGFLPYFDFGGKEYHFGGHVVVACGHDPAGREILIADRDGLHPVPMAALALARGSKFRPFPPENEWFAFDFSGKRQPTAGEVRQAIGEQARPMLEPPISNLGVKGIRKAGQAVPHWGKSMAGEELRWALFNTYIMLSPVGGTGGGAFRYMFSRFLAEAASIPALQAGTFAADPRLADSAVEFRRIGDGWEALGEWFRRTSETPDPASHLAECASLFRDLADQEQAAWTRLQQVASE